MVELGQAGTVVLSLALIGAGVYLMNMFFNWFGALLFALLMLPMVIAVVWIVNQGQQSGGTQTDRSHVSKGARQRREE